MAYEVHDYVVFAIHGVKGNIARRLLVHVMSVCGVGNLVSLLVTRQSTLFYSSSS